MNYENDIKVRTQNFAVTIIRYTFELKKNKIDFAVIDQLLRSGASIGANVREAKASSSKKELIRFYEIGLRSANETEYWMEVITEAYNFSQENTISIKKELTEIMKVLGSIVVNLKK